MRKIFPLNSFSSFEFFSLYKRVLFYFPSSVYLSLIKVSSVLEMSDLSSRILVEENSCCESDSEIDNSRSKNKYKSRKKRDPVMNNQHQQESSDDETESQQMNYDEVPINSTPLSSPMSIYNQDKMRRRLQFFFMNPIEKWQAKRRYRKHKKNNSLSNE